MVTYTKQYTHTMVYCSTIKKMNYRYLQQHRWISKSLCWGKGTSHKRIDPWMIPFTQKSRNAMEHTGKESRLVFVWGGLSLEWVAKGQEEFSGDNDGNVWCLDFGSSLMSIYTCQNSLNYILNVYGWLYIMHTSMKLQFENKIEPSGNPKAKSTQCSISPN